MLYHYCLNCGDTTEKNFCSNCGQKTDTHRLTPKHFFLHDIVHGVWHLDKGILFTLKEAITRPGQAALDYIKGKRVKYYNVFYLCLILVGLNFLVVGLSDNFNESVNYEEKGFEKFTSEHAKFFIFLYVPVFAFLSKWIFKKMNLNIAEHFIPAGITLVRILLISLIANTIYIFFQNIFTSLSVIIIIFISVAMVYFDLGKDVYLRPKLIFKSLLIPFLALVFTILLYSVGEFVIRKI